MEDKEANAKIKQVVEQQTYFFDDLIIEEILLRLPIKSILRFKSVSKQWYSTLSSSNFINAHFMKSPSSDPSAPVDTLLIKSSNNYYLFSYDDDDDQISGNFEDNLVKLGVEFGMKEDHTVLTGCCNGLICLTLENGHYFTIWNPATRKMHKYKSYKYFPSSDVSGFGYVSSVDDYKYVRVSKSGGDTDIIVHIFSIREKKWRKLYFDRQDVLFIHGQAALINETLYWYAIRDNNYNVSCIVSFDIGVERFDIIKSSHLIFGVMGGCLSLYNRNKYFTGDKLMHIVPIVEPHAIGKSIDVPKTLRVDQFSQMVGFTRTGKFFMTGPPNEELTFYPRLRGLPNDEGVTFVLGIVDTGTKPLRYTTLLRFQGYTTIARYVPSLVSPFLIQEPSEK